MSISNGESGLSARTKINAAIAAVPPAGGTARQVLAKASATDNDHEWINRWGYGTSLPAVTGYEEGDIFFVYTA